MSSVISRLSLLAAIATVTAACQADSYSAPRGYQAAPPPYGNPYYAPGGYYTPAPAYGYAQPAPSSYYYASPQPTYGYASQRPGVVYNQADGRRYTTVTVTNRGQNGYRDDVVQQQVVCGSQYYDGYRQRIARC
jgi:hypothetical protein